jgi:uncharacterized protein
MSSLPAMILASEMRLMESKHSHRNYRITISLPYAYNKSANESGPFDNQRDKWPVVYLLDANWYFGMVTDMVRSMAWCGGTYDAIVVGIGYPETNDPQESWREAMARRNIDFTPIQSDEREERMSAFLERPIQTGRAEDFHKFLKNDLIPAIERDYRADSSQRILAGHSLSGEFVTFALFHEPNLFHTFIIGSASYGDYDRYFFRQEEAFFKAQKQLTAKVYLSVGELEEAADNTAVTDMLRFAAILESRGYEGLSLVKRVFTNCNHCEVIALGLQAGLMFALKNNSQS